jgi:hypothetical protein
MTLTSKACFTWKKCCAILFYPVLLAILATTRRPAHRAGFKGGGDTGAVAPGVHKTKIEFTDFIETFTSLKSREVNLYL